MVAFAVKHIVGGRGQGPLISILKEVRTQPYSLTSKSLEAKQAALGCNVYVIEVIRPTKQPIYRLGYRYRAYECYEQAGGTLWKGRFKFKNSASPDVPPEGVYFECPVVIVDPDFIEWYKSETLGMTEIPDKHIRTLERMISDPENAARPF